MEILRFRLEKLPKFVRGIAKSSSNFLRNIEQQKAKCENHQQFFLLSHQPNYRVPFIIDSLELARNEKFGRYVVTKKLLSPGDVIAIEKPFIRFVDLSILNLYKNQLCYNCLSSHVIHSFLPASHSVMVCSEKCRDEILNRNIEAEEKIEEEFGWKITKAQKIFKMSLEVMDNVDALRQLSLEPQSTVFDYDLSDEFNLNKYLLKCLISLTSTPYKEREVSNFELILSFFPKGQREFLKNFIHHMMGVCVRNQFSMYHYCYDGNCVKLGTCLLPFGSLISHSCDPNVYVQAIDGTFVFIVTKPIRAGEQIFQCYRKTFFHESLEERQSQLYQQYGFRCSCDACSKNYATSQAMKSEDCFEELPSRLWNRIQENWWKIGNNFDHQSYQANSLQIEHNIELIKKFVGKIVNSQR